MKQTMKRILSLLLALCMILALSSCGKKETGTGTPASSAGTTTQTPAPAPEPEPEPAMPDMNDLLSADEVDKLVDAYENDGSNDYTHWYPDGDKYAEFYLMFEDTGTLIIRDANGDEYYTHYFLRP